MIRFEIEGRYIDLYNGMRLQFVKSNSCLAFDELQLNRTTQFDIPRTPLNDAIFSHAGNPSSAGTQARRRIAAQMQYSGGAEDGYLYMTAAAADRYTVCFVFGELTGLRAIREAGTLREVLAQRWVYPNYGGALLWRRETHNATPANARLYVNDYAVLKYMPYAADNLGYYYQTDRCNFLPSYSLQYITDEALAALGVTLRRNDSSGMMPLYRIVQAGGGDVNGSLDFAQAYGSTLHLLYNLPDLAVTDLLKTEAALLGKQLRYSAGTISYESISVESWSIEDITRVAEIGDVTRDFGKLAQTNYIACKDETYIGADEHNRRAYAIDNENLAATSDIYTIPLNGGASVRRELYYWPGTTVDAGAVNDLDVAGSNDGFACKFAGKRATLLACTQAEQIGPTGIAEAYMTTAPIVENATLTRLCAASTRLTVTTPMTLYAFASLPETVLLNLRGTLYVWTSAEWGDGLARLTLQKAGL